MPDFRTPARQCCAPCKWAELPIQPRVTLTGQTAVISLWNTVHLDRSLGVRYVKPGGEAIAEVTELLDIAPPRRG